MSNEGTSSAEHERSKAQLQASAEREMSAFIAAVNQLFDAELGRKAENNWIKELDLMNWPSDASAINWRKLTIAAAFRLLNTNRKANQTGGRSRVD
jgi:hypothetical protein